MLRSRCFLSLLLSWAFGDKFSEIQLNLSISYCKDTEPFAYQRVPYPLSPTSEVISRTPENFVKPFVRWLALDAFVPK
jgi:hypothetical protein